MVQKDISENVKDFIFMYVDSVEQLEVLLLLRADHTRYWTAEQLSDELRSSPSAMVQRLSVWKELQLVQETSKSSVKEYRYSTREVKIENLISELFEAYRTRKYRVLELIFSPIKKVRDFADAFQIAASKEKTGSTGESDG